MVHAAAAAIGAHRGSRHRVSSRHREERLRRQSLDKWEARINQELLNGIFTVYDIDKSGSINRDEARMMLRDVGSQCVNIDEYPSVDDIDFLFCLCGLTKQDGSDALSGYDVILLCDAWKSYLKRRDEVRQILTEFDLNEDGKIQESELPAVLKSLNHDKEVPHDVVIWVLQQADVTRDGVLNSMELARGMCACYHWLGVEDPNGIMEFLGDHIRGSADLPRPRRSSLMAGACSMM